MSALVTEYYCLFFVADVQELLVVAVDAVFHIFAALEFPDVVLIAYHRGPRRCFALP